jgi:transcriptional regulator with XRE-family HTH domain
MGNKIGIVLRKLRDKKGFTAKQAVLHLLILGFDISEKTLYGYESGARMPNSDLFMALCAIYEVENILGEFGYKDLKDTMLFSNNEWELLRHFRDLNTEGQQKIVDYITDLKATEMYNTQKAEEPDYLMPNAAHNDFANNEEELRLMQEDLDEL